MAKTVYFKDSLTGGSSNALDGVNGDSLQDKDAAFVVDGNNFRVYMLDANNSAEEQPPGIIAPDSNPGTKRWVLKGSSADSDTVYATWRAAKSGEPYPLSLTNFEKYLSKYTGELWVSSRFSQHYNSCLGRLVLNDGSVIESSSGFSSLSDIVSWINSVAPNDGSHFLNTPYLFTLFDRVSSDIPPILKVYGVNWLYTSVFRPRWARGNAKTAYRTHNKALCKNIIVKGSSFFKNSGAIPCSISSSDYDTVGDDARRVLWAPGNKINLYGLPKVGSAISFDEGINSDDPRYAWDCTTSSIIPVQVGDRFSLDSYLYLSSFGLYDVDISPADSYWSFLVNFLAGDVSVAILYLLTKVGSGGNQFALYLKPLGLDRVLVDYFDTSKYQLEAVSFWKGRRPRLRKMPSGSGEQFQSKEHNRTRVLKDDWTSSIIGMKNVGNLGEFSLPRIKFRLRRLSDNKVGPLSSATIVPEIRRRHALLKWVVR